MAIIDSAGLFLGDRLGWCSDVSQLHWPRLYSAANNYARIELNYRKVISKAYANFRTPPTEQEFWEMIREYKDNFLLLLYQDSEGVLWGQWQTNERYLLGHKNAEDKRSPTPPLDAQDAYRKAYLDKMKAKSNSNLGLADLFGVVSSCSDLPEKLKVTLVGVGVGVGGGEGGGAGEGKKQQPAASAAWDLPPWVDQEAWKAYEEMRRKIRKPMTPRARELVLKKLAGFEARGLSSTESLNQSVVGSWTDVYEPKGSGGGIDSNGSGAKHGSGEAIRAAVQRRIEQEDEDLGDRDRSGMADGGLVARGNTADDGCLP
jgi:hypothetical protein